MTHPQQPHLRGQAEPPFELPLKFTIGTGRWWLGMILGAVAGVVLTCVALGVPESLTGHFSLWWRSVAAFMGPVSLLLAIYCGRAALHPDHISVTDRGISTPSWNLGWDELVAIKIIGDPASHKGQVLLGVTDEAFAREGGNNRWFSGRPFGMGGLMAKEPVIRLQAGTKAMPTHIEEAITRVKNYHDGRDPRGFPGALPGEGSH